MPFFYVAVFKPSGILNARQETKMKRKFYRILAAAAGLSMLLLSLAGCSSTANNQAAAGADAGGSGGSNYWNQEENSAASDTVTGTNTNVSVDYSDFDVLETWDGNACTIELNGGGASVSGIGASVSNGNGFCMVEITQGGTYVISGTLENGQIYVAAGENQVHLVLNGAAVTCKTSAPIYVNNGKKTVITLAGGTENSLTDGAQYAYAITETEDETGEVTGEPNAALFSKKALTINGGGALSVTGNFNNGITCKDDLKIMNGTITVTAKNHGIRGNDSVAVKSGTIRITAAEGDGMKSTKKETAEKGYVYVENAAISIEAGDDGIQAATLLAVLDGTISIACAKDGFHSDGDISVSGAAVSIAAGDDGMHADGTLTVLGGAIEISESYEGLEALVINIAGGTIHLKASDDGLNASSGGSSAGTNDGRGPGGGFGGGMQYESACQINITGGSVYVDAEGDGIDSNGDLTISGGCVIINGPTGNGDGALDTNGTILVTGGFLVAAGSSGMAETPEGTSTQNVIVTTFPQQQQAGSIVRIVDAAGNDLLTFSPSKTYSSVLFSSPDLKNGTEYTVYTGGSYSDGIVRDGLMAGGSYAGGTSFGSVTVSAILSYIGTAGSGIGGGGGFGGGGNRGGRPGR